MNSEFMGSFAAVMKKLIFCGCLILAAFFCKAQQSGKAGVFGSVIDSVSKAPLEYATITVFAAGETKTLTGTTTGQSGEFTLSDLEPGTYRILIESIGYRPATIKNVVVSKKKEQLDLRTISLAKDRNTLQDVVVTSTRGPIENKIDKLVFNAEKDLTSAGGVATDLLKKVPQVSVDVDGNVQLAGNSSIRFLINGRPSSAFGSNVADVLQSIPASQIKSIEVVTNPGAKYDAQGLGGIINIILKQSKVKGINGNISLSAGTRAQNGSFNLNARKGNFGVGAYVSGNIRPAVSAPFRSDRTAADTANAVTSLLHQQGSNRFRRGGYQAGVNMDWSPKKSDVFSGSLNYNEFGNKGNSSTAQSQQVTDDATGALLSETDTRIQANNRFTFHNWDVSLGYKHTFKKDGQELEWSFNSSTGNNFSTVNNAQFLLPQDTMYYGNTSTNPAKEKETEIKLDYTDPLGKDVTLGVGGKLNFYDINSVSEVNSFNAYTKGYEPDASLSNSLRYRQKVYALYTELGFPVGKTMEAKAGVRYERTEIDSYYSNAQQQANSPGYNTFVPSVFLLKNCRRKIPSS